MQSEGHLFSGRYKALVVDGSGEGYLKTVCPAWLRVDRLLGAHGIGEDTPEGRQEFQRRLEGRRHAEAEDEAAEQIRRGWCFGSAEFRQELLDPFGEVQGEHHTAEIRLESARARAERMILNTAV